MDCTPFGKCKFWAFLNRCFRTLTSPNPIFDLFCINKTKDGKSEFLDKNKKHGLTPLENCKFGLLNCKFGLPRLENANFGPF